MTSPILFAGQEDLSFIPLGTSFSNDVPNARLNNITSGGNITLDSGYNVYRPGFARSAITIGMWNNRTSADNTLWVRTAYPFNAAVFWTSARLYLDGASVPNIQSVLMRWADATGQVRLQLVTTTALPSTVMLQSVDATNTIVTMATSSGLFGNNRPSIPDKIDVLIDYATAGSFTLYCNGISVLLYSGDITTNGVTDLSSVDFGSAFGGGNDNAFTSWSEMIVATADTRNWSLVTQVPVANGNATAFDNNSFANMSGYLADYTSPDFSDTAGEIQQYQVTPGIPGTLSVVSVVQHAAVVVAAGGPQNMEFMVRTGGADFNSTSIAPASTWSVLQNTWDLNPATGLAWLPADLADTNASFNIGIQSLA